MFNSHDMILKPYLKLNKKIFFFLNFDYKLFGISKVSNNTCTFFTMYNYELYLLVELYHAICKNLSHCIQCNNTYRVSNCIEFKRHKCQLLVILKNIKFVNW